MPAHGGRVGTALAWALFSVLFWVAAYCKPFHIDEYYSWVYAERSSWKEILFLKDGGIGHPPVFHLVQKSVQAVFPRYHPLQVRLGNYLLGSVFVLLLSSMLAREKRAPLLAWGAAASACVLDAFVFARMWGALLLVSLLVFRAGEKCSESPCGKNIASFLSLFALGLATDYGFVLLVPYAVLVLEPAGRLMGLARRAMFPAMLLAWLAVEWHRASGAVNFVYRCFTHIGNLAVKTGLMLLGFRFREPFLAAVLVLLLSLWLSARDRKGPERSGSERTAAAFMACGALLLLPALFQESEAVRVRYVVLAVLPLLALAAWGLWTARAGSGPGGSDRLILSAAGGSLILFILSPFFYRNLVDKRFLLVMAPFYLFLFVRHFRKVVLVPLCVLLFASGLLYVSSSVVDDMHPPPAFGDDAPLVFENEMAYSTRYLARDRIRGGTPYFLEPWFDTFCRTCSMGTTDIPFGSLGEKVRVVQYTSPRYFDPRTRVPEEFRLVGRREVGLFPADRFQFRHFTLLLEKELKIGGYVPLVSDFLREEKKGE